MYQQDDIFDAQFTSKKKLRWIHEPTNKIVRAINRKQAIKQLKESYNITADKTTVRQALIIEPLI